MSLPLVYSTWVLLDSMRNSIYLRASFVDTNKTNPSTHKGCAKKACALPSPLCLLVFLCFPVVPGALLVQYLPVNKDILRTNIMQENKACSCCSLELHFVLLIHHKKHSLAKSTHASITRLALQLSLRYLVFCHTKPITVVPTSPVMQLV